MSKRLLDEIDRKVVVLRQQLDECEKMRVVIAENPALVSLVEEVLKNPRSPQVATGTTLALPPETKKQTPDVDYAQSATCIAIMRFLRACNNDWRTIRQITDGTGLKKEAIHYTLAISPVSKVKFEHRFAKVVTGNGPRDVKEWRMKQS